MCGDEMRYGVGLDHANGCPESVPHRLGFFRGVPIVADLPGPVDGFQIVKSNPLTEPNCWHATKEAVAKLRARGELVEPS